MRKVLAPIDSGALPGSASLTSARPLSSGIRAPAGSIHRAIVWQDRTADECVALKATALNARTAAHWRARPLFLSNEIAWILDNVAGAHARAHNEASWLAAQSIVSCSGGSPGASFTTHVTGASRTSLYDIREQRWDGTVPAFSRAEALLRKCMTTVASLNDTRLAIRCPASVAGMAGDQQAALFGQACF